MGVPTISPAELQERVRAGANPSIIDVRAPVEYRELHAVGAESVPLDRLDPKALAERPGAKGAGPLYLICKTGSRGRQACEKLIAAGIADVVNVEGGTAAWEAAGLPVVRGKKAMSLERQVRIAAGLLVLTGVGLGWFVHPGFLGLAAFVGAGLTFAGITDTCGMGMILARMPWNQIGADAPAACEAKS